MALVYLVDVNNVYAGTFDIDPNEIPANRKNIGYPPSDDRIGCWEHPDLLWHRVTPEKGEQIKRNEILKKINAISDSIYAEYGELEKSTWSNQEAGARRILGTESETKDSLAKLILKDEAATESCVAFVNELATAAAESPEEYAARILARADTAHDTITSSLPKRVDYVRRVDEIVSSDLTDDEKCAEFVYIDVDF